MSSRQRLRLLLTTFILASPALLAVERGKAAPVRPKAWYVTLSGVGDLRVVDFTGRRSIAGAEVNGDSSPFFSLFPIGNHMIGGVLNGDHDYALRMHLAGDILFRVDRGSSQDDLDATTLFATPVEGGAYQLVLRTNGTVDLQRDALGNGTYTKSVRPTKRLGARADRTPPVITVNAVQVTDGVSVSASVTDDSTPAPVLWYSTNAGTFAAYTGPVVVPLSPATVSFFSEDDNLNQRYEETTIATKIAAGSIPRGGGVTVTITSGRVTLTTTADDAGHFSSPVPLLLGGQVTVTPTAPGFKFSPASITSDPYDGRTFQFTAEAINGQ